MLLSPLLANHCDALHLSVGSRLTFCCTHSLLLISSQQHLSLPLPLFTLRKAWISPSMRFLPLLIMPSSCACASGNFLLSCFLGACVRVWLMRALSLSRCLFSQPTKLLEFSLPPVFGLLRFVCASAAMVDFRNGTICCSFFFFNPRHFFFAFSVTNFVVSIFCFHLKFQFLCRSPTSDHRKEKIALC